MDIFTEARFSGRINIFSCVKKKEKNALNINLSNCDHSSQVISKISLCLFVICDLESCVIAGDVVSGLGGGKGVTHHRRSAIEIGGVSIKASSGGANSG